MTGLSQTYRFTLLAALATLLLAGCAEQGRPLMPTPTIYTGASARPVLDGVPAERHSSPLDLLYFTNRVVVDESNEMLSYGSERSKSIAFGSVRVDMGSGLDWNELVAASQSDRRRVPVKLKLAGTTEMGCYPPSPYLVRYTESGLIRDPEVMATHRKVEQDLKMEFERRLSELPKKEIVLYIHGFNETFQEAAFITAELCHFFGREQLCALFSWPAGGGGRLLFAYGQDRESGDFSVGHLKKVIRSITKAPGIEKVHLLAHSRGSAVLLQALRELMLEIYAFGEAPVDVLKIENLVLMAADVDIEVALQKLTLYGSDPEILSHWQREELPATFTDNGRITIYTSATDRALLASAILFRSQRRLGRVRTDDLSGHVQEFLAEKNIVNVIQAPRKRMDFFGHSYFSNNPAVSSDLVALIRYGLKPTDSRRALRPVAPPLVWAIEETH